LRGRSHFSWLPSLPHSLYRCATTAVRRRHSKESALARCIPSFLVRFLTGLLLDKFAGTVPVPATLVRLSDVIDRLSLGTIDVLKVDVEGAELAALAGIEDRHWPRVQQASGAAVAGVLGGGERGGPGPAARRDWRVPSADVAPPGTHGVTLRLPDLFTRSSCHCRAAASLAGGAGG
jgi:hypothetical protein